MKDFYIKILAIFFLVFVSSSVLAQRTRGLMVEGSISVEEGSPDGIIIEMYEDGKKAEDYGVGSDGRYKLELQYNHKFELVFKREGNFKQKIVVETAVPREVLQSNPRFPEFPVHINLFKEIPGIDNSFSENTVLKIFYSPSVDNFVSELYYNDAQIQKLIEQAVLQSQIVDNRAEYMAALTRAELAELRKEYNKLLEQAGNEYANEQFLDALDGYKAASKIFPQEQFPKDRIAEINDLLGLIMASEEMNKAMLERFNKLVKDGDLKFSQTQYAEAKNSYSRALSIKPNDGYVNGQLDKIAAIQKQQMQEEEYQNLVASGDKALKELLYNEAIGQFQKALEIKPNAQYPKSKIDEINGLLANQREDQQKQQNYDDAMREGERQFTKQFYDRALTAFENALTYRPNDQEATQRIADTKKMMQDILNQMTFDRLIAEADKAYKKEEYSAALSNYEEAMALFPDDPRTKKRVEEIRQILYAQQSLESYISQADKQFDAQKYADAKSLYERALELDSKNKHVSDRIEEINQIMVGMELDAQYNEVIATADDFLENKNYENARSRYNQALQLKPRESYPKDKIGEIENILAGIAKTNADYQAAISRADRYYQDEKYVDAKATFTEAGSIKPNETYPAEMIGKIDGLIAEQERLAQEAAEAEAAHLAAIQAEKDKNYAAAIAKADNLFNEENYENSRTEYRVALDIKPEEVYPQQRIDEIGNILAQLSATQAAYEAAITKGDREFNREGWDEAIVAYNEAKQAKADETYPAEQLAKIDSIVTARERLAREAAEAEAARLAAIQAEKDKNYAATIARADNLFKEENYENSRTEYRAALDIKPEESYPQQRIDEIGNILAQLSATQAAYEAAITKGDREFNREGWDVAITAYNEAKQAKADETYPDDQLAKIDSIVTARERLAREAAEAEAARLAAIQAEKDKNYAAAIAKADNLFNEENYENSRTEYRAALDIKPEENYPQQRIDEIGNILAQLSATQAAYEAAITKGDREFNREGWDAAITAYNEAKQAKADETYPDEQLAKIDSIVTTRERLAREAVEAREAELAAVLAEKKEKYNAIIVNADSLLDVEQYNLASAQYELALTYLPDEMYPQQRIGEISAWKTITKEIQDKYEDAIIRGDREFHREGWDDAIAAYNEAKQTKADETYPDEQLAKIDSIVTTRERIAREAAEAEAARLAAIQAEKDKNYADAIARADKLFKEENYENSRTEYRAALDIKPEETYPQQRIDEIGNLLAQLLAAQASYEAAITKGDREFNREGWDAAITAYNEAKQAKADETYPAEQLAKVDSIVTSRERLAQEAAEAEAARLAAIQAEKDKNYTDAIARADNLFNEENYKNSRTEYRAALDIKPEESYPQQRIDEIGNLLARLSAAQAAYEAAITRGDREFNREGWDAAITAYNEAKQAKADETYPAEQLAKIDSIVTTRERIAREAAEAEAARLAAIQAEKDKNYADAIARADNLFNEQSYENSRTEYRAALDIKSEESYPQQRIDEIDGILRELAAAKVAQEERDRKYATLITQADRYFKANSLDPAKENYEEALTLKPEEAYPKQKLAEIDSIFNQRVLDEKYRNIIVVADGDFRTKKYDDARLQYELSLGVKPNEEYPRSQIRRIDEIKAEEEARKQAEIANQQDLQQRKANIEAMQEELDEQRILEESGINALYDQLITKADAFFDDTQYNVSRAWYFKALDLKPEETYPQQRIDEINRIINGMMLSQRDREYQRFIDLADNSFRENELAVARGWYNQALGQKSGEQYPKDQLAEIEKRVQERLEGRSADRVAQYKITAKNALEAGNMNVARFWYKKALELNPEDQEAKDGLSKTR